jgi:hypothetical protein
VKESGAKRGREAGRQEGREAGRQGGREALTNSGTEEPDKPDREVFIRHDPSNVTRIWPFVLVAQPGKILPVPSTQYYHIRFTLLFPPDLLGTMCRWWREDRSSLIVKLGREGNDIDRGVVNTFR